jgi:hypothetical protein
MDNNIDYINIDYINIINILIDLCDLSYEEIKLKLREYHYCIECKKHFRHCNCDNDENCSNDDQSNDLESDYLSSSAHTDDE